MRRQFPVEVVMVPGVASTGTQKCTSLIQKVTELALNIAVDCFDV